MNPNYANAYNFLGYLAAAQGKYDEAISYLQKYAFLAPDLANPHDSLGEILMHIGRYEDAEREYRKALEIQPDFFNSLLMLAQVYIEQGRVTKGVDILEKTRDQIAGTKFELHVDYLLVNTYYTHKLEKECGQACVRFFTSHPDFFDSAHFRSYHLTLRGKFDEARSVHDSLMAAAAEYKWVKESERGQKWLAQKRNCFEANFAEALNELDSAAALWEQCVAGNSHLAPHDRHGHMTSYAEVLLKLGRHEDAFNQSAQILSTNPNLIRPLLTFVSAAAALGRYDEARTAMARLDAILAQADDDLPAQVAAEKLRSQISRFPSS
jgi:tetratricopeptide (TPR) repeat protein